jgi:hypothetical protein
VITRPVPDGLLCIRQLDHAALSGELARAWGGTMPALCPREPVELAIGRHDAGWTELDREPVHDAETGFPHTYRTHATPDALGVAERSVSRVGALDPYAGWLVSRHFVSFHAGSESPAARTWVTAQVGHRAELLGRAWPRVGRDALHPHVLEANFDWLQLLDAVSLALCEDWESWESRETCAEYGESTTRFRYRRRKPAADPLRVRGSVEPWPFARESVVAGVPAVLLPPAPWPDADALARDWAIARSERLEVELAAG